MLGRSTIKPSKAVVAGSFVTINYKYQVTHPVDDSGCIGKSRSMPPDLECF